MNVVRERRPVFVIELTEEEAREFDRAADALYCYEPAVSTIFAVMANALDSAFYAHTGEHLNGQDHLTVVS